jgi:alcohol dehydrogenase class IV
MKYRRRERSRAWATGELSWVTDITGQAIDSGGGVALLAAQGVRRAAIAVTLSLAGSEILADALRGFEARGITLVELASRPTNRDVDGILSVGGGSTIRAAREFAGSLPAVRHVAVPTTTSCVEQFDDPGAPRPDAVIIDVRGIRGVPRLLRSAQAFNAMTFAFAAVCENEVSPADVELAREAVVGLRRGLLCAAATDDLDDDSIGDVVRCSERRGSGVLPFALAYLRRARADRIALFAPAFECSETGNAIEAADAVIAAVRNLGQNAGIPRNFRTAGITRDAMESAAKSVPQLPAAKHYARPIESADQIMNELFRFAW